MKRFGDTRTFHLDAGKDLVEPLEWRKRSPIGGADLSSSESRPYSLTIPSSAM